MPPERRCIPEADECWADIVGLDPVKQADTLIRLWPTLQDMGESTVARMAAIARGYAATVAASGAGSLTDGTTDQIAQYLRHPTAAGTAPSIHTMHLRRTTIRALHRSIFEMGGPDHDPSKGLALPPKTERAARPLTDAEVVLLRTAALAHRGRGFDAAAVVALGEATASTGEIPRIRWCDIDFDQGAIALPGVGRVQPRGGVLTNWGRSVLEHRRPHAPQHDFIAAARPHNAPSSQAATVMLIRKLLTAATLAVEADLKPNSLRLWAGDRLRRDGATIDEVARRLGITSLDTTARAIGWDWCAP